MPRPARKLALVPEAPAALHRRRQRVVVRAPGSTVILDEPGERRQHFPTLSGLGFRDESDTLPAFGTDEAELTPVSCVRSRAAVRVPKAARSLILPPRARPLTLLDDVDDDVAKKYREEADRLIASGIFDDWAD